MLERHGWGELFDELHGLSRQGRWQDMGAAIDDEILHAFAVVAEPGAVAGELLRRYGDLFTRMSLYTPYAIDPEITATITTILNAPAP